MHRLDPAIRAESLSKRYGETWRDRLELATARGGEGALWRGCGLGRSWVGPVECAALE
jgi:hypothetical protein